VDPLSDPAATGSSEVLASYKVTMSVEGSTEQALAFLTGLDQAPRLAVVGNTELSRADGVARLTVTATFFLQQVEVDAIIAQIETLTALDAPQAEEAPAEEAAAEAEAGDDVADTAATN